MSLTPLQQALLLYVGEQCPNCGKIYETIEDLENCPWVYTGEDILICEHCYVSCYIGK